MLTAAARYAFLDTRISILSERLIQPAMFTAFLHTPESEQRAWLGAIGVDYQPGTPFDPQRLERAMNAALLRDVDQIIRPLDGEAREFFKHWAHRFELSNLKFIIRGRLHGQTPQSIKQELVTLGQHERLPIDQLLAAEDIQELLRLLEQQSHYAEIARQARRALEEHHDAFILEATIDRHFFAGLSKLAQHYKGAGHALLRELVGDLIDRVNLMWLLRYRFTYGLQPAEAYYLLVPTTGRLRSETLLAMAEADSFAQMRPLLPRHLAQWIGEAEHINDIHRHAKRGAHHRAEAILRRTRFNPARALAYLMLRESNLNRLASVIRGYALQLDTAHIAHAVGITTDPANAA
ncbi:V0D/AC39 family V-type ATPase subunit [Thiorhodospira sibirica]|uniref:V0D/AC39 family V-type ATPase subunit n=1 Tax=Thiorhodospira sibirica TaxID=154347 RepID=UPI00022C463E|nr:V-type ATPase subunit [Thiorhodospira sibirica]